MSGGEYQRAKEDTAEKMRQKQKAGLLSLPYCTDGSYRKKKVQWANVFVFISGRAQSSCNNGGEQEIMILDALLQCNARPEYLGQFVSISSLFPLSRFSINAIPEHTMLDCRYAGIPVCFG